ncbi:adenylosuccinate synthase [Spirochaeta isovalerica]|uniref:Adenylosuccinate synthetase n=1 Tax=Spirochaeta isovalerica TaxID=150 RepID=A0A841R0U0_9SPIO|nr:adenylosuccinate synthase [Spirochaeta isovalerica]MBB6478564.1 adenylosuccinate synthase [Spirochaeta isovalerica]
MKLVVIGAQWGDEGKGKIVDYLSEESSIVVRFSGGANAGHTIVVGEKVYKLHLIPSGIVNPDKTAILGSGMVIDPESMFKELEGLEAEGLDCKGRILVSDRAHIVLPRYRDMDVEIDKSRKNPIGTTGRGIGVTYALKSSRDGFRVGDMYDENRYAMLEEEDRRFLDPFKEKMRDMVCNISQYLYENKDKNILFEGAQGVLLDLDSGTYPYVSSGYSSSAGAAMGSGIGPRQLDRIYGVFKAYSTRVGNGPFPSEYDRERDGDLGDQILKIGQEFGVTTGRARRCGYLDLVALKYACWSNSIDYLVMTKIDIFDSFDEIKVCTGYEIDGEVTDVLPARIDLMAKAKPVTRTFKGWKSDLTKCSSYEELPGEVKDYISFIEDYVETPIGTVSVGPDRNQTFNRVQPWG